MLRKCTHRLNERKVLPGASILPEIQEEAEKAVFFAIWSGVANANSSFATEGLFCHGYLSKLLKHLFLSSL